MEVTLKFNLILKQHMSFLLQNNTLYLRFPRGSQIVLGQHLFSAFLGKRKDTKT